VRLSQATQPKWSGASNPDELTASTNASPSLRSTHTTSVSRTMGMSRSSSCADSTNTRAGASPIASSSELIAGSDAESPTMT